MTLVFFYSAGNKHTSLPLTLLVNGGKYIVLPRGQDNILHPRSLLLDFKITYGWFGLSNLHTNGKVTYSLRSTGDLHPEGDLNNTGHIKNNHYHRIYDELKF